MKTYLNKRVGVPGLVLLRVATCSFRNQNIKLKCFKNERYRETGMLCSAGGNVKPVKLLEVSVMSLQNVIQNDHVIQHFHLWVCTGSESRHYDRCLYTRVQSSVIYNSQKGEAAEVSINGWLTGQNVVYTYPLGFHGCITSTPG